jgi:glycosyltransferase involved in cell wall biosynthesis
MPNSFNSVSVVIATYNGEHYLREQLDSILSQTIQPLEVIIQDDCSNDSTVALIQEYFSRLPILLKINEKNIGYIRNFEHALSQARGDYIAICDQDDIWEANKLELLLSNIGDSSLIYSNSLLIDSDANSLNKTLSDKLKNRFISTHSPLSFVYDNCVSAHAMLFSRSLLPQLFPFPKHLYFDAWITANAASANGIHYLDQSLVQYRQHSTNTLSITQKASLSFREKIALKTQKKRDEHTSRVEIINDLLSIVSLTQEEQNLLRKLRQEHLSFPKHWFNIIFFALLLQNKNTLFAITKRNPFILAFKKAIGFKLYHFFPFL